MKGLKKQRDVLTSNIQQYRNTTAFGSDSDPNVPEKETFVSSFDGQQGFYALSPPFMPSKAEDSTLIVYFPGMGSTYMEPYLVPKDKSIAQVCRDQLRQGAFLSVDYRGKASWLNQAALADVDQNVQAALLRFPARKIILVGTSMGGCSALSYSYLAAPDIKEKIVGVLACEGAGDLVALYKETDSDLVRKGLIEAFGGLPEIRGNEYAHHSILSNLAMVNRKVRYVLLSASQDDVVPSALQKSMAEKLKGAVDSVELIEFPDRHGVPEAAVYEKGLQSLVK